MNKITKFLEFCGSHEPLVCIAVSAYCIMCWKEEIRNKIRGIK